MARKSKEADSPCCPSDRTGYETKSIHGEEADQALSQFAKALGHPARVQIMRLLTTKISCICGEIVDEVRLAQSTISQHLKVLKDSGLIQGTIDGPKVCYCIDPGALKYFKVLVASL